MFFHVELQPGMAQAIFIVSLWSRYGCAKSTTNGASTL
jgi:hypothetical protein